MENSVDKIQPSVPYSPAGLDFKRILAISFRRRWLILAIALPILIVATVGTIRSTDMVTASSRVMIEANDTDELMYRSGRSDFTEILATAAQISMSIPVADKAATALMDSIPLLAEDDPDFQGEITQADLRDALLSGVDCGPVGESRIMRIAFSAPNPRFSLMAVDAITEAFIQYSVDRVRNKKAIGYFDEQIADTHSEIDSLLTVRAEILNSSEYSTFKISAQTESNHTRVLELDYQRARSARSGLQAKYDGFVKAMQENPDFVPVNEGGRFPLLVDRKMAVEAAKKELAALRNRYQESFALVQDQIATLATARDALREEQQNFLRDLRIQLEEASMREAIFAKAIQDRQTALLTFPAIERQVDSINLLIDTKRDLLKSLQVRRGEARLRADTDRRISNIIPLDTPSLDLEVAGSKKVLYLALAGFFAIALGLMAALFVDSQDHRLYDQREVEHYLQIPVMGSISDAVEIKD